jgi:hypothetical protein
LSVLTGTLFGVTALAPRPGHAAGAQDCIAAHADGQVLRRAGKLRAGRERFLACSASVCPGPVQSDCAQWAREVEAQIPTVIVIAKDAGGARVAGMQVHVDGALSVEQGREVPLDPGEHLFRVEAQDGRFVELHAQIVAGEHAREITGILSAQAGGSPGTPPPSPPPPSAAGLPLGFYALMTTGAISAAAFAFFAITGKYTENSLRASCAHACTHDQVSEVRRDYLLADVALGAGVAALGGALWIALSHSSHAKASRSAIHIEPALARVGAGASVGAHF